MSGISTEPIVEPLAARLPDDETILLPGWPGYRTQPGRSGLDYIDTQLEMAHMAGIFLHQFFSGRWLRPGFGPHPFVILIVGIALWIAFPGSAGACFAVPIVLLIGLVAAIRNRSVLHDNKEAEKVAAIPEEEDGWGEDNAFGKDNGISPGKKDG